MLDQVGVLKVVFYHLSSFSPSISFLSFPVPRAYVPMVVLCVLLRLMSSCGHVIVSHRAHM